MGSRGHKAFFRVRERPAFRSLYFAPIFCRNDSVHRAGSEPKNGPGASGNHKVAVLGIISAFASWLLGKSAPKAHCSNCANSNRPCLSTTLRLISLNCDGYKVFVGQAPFFGRLDLFLLQYSRF